MRVHHRLLAIHPFPNGNGRHSRLMSDLLIERLGGASFSWGGGSLTDTGELRRRYVDALRAADNHDMGRFSSLHDRNNQEVRQFSCEFLRLHC